MAKGKKGGKQQQTQDKQQQPQVEATPVQPEFHNAVAIDFGDDCCSVGYFSHKENKVVIIQNEDGDFTTPSVLSFTQEEILIGKPARQNQPRNAKNTVYNIKSLLSATHKEDTTHTTYPFQNDGSSVTVEYKGEQKTYQLHELIGMILGKMKSIAEHYLSKTVKRCVVTVPKHFDEQQREVILRACKDLELQVLQLVDDPIAATICYGLDIPQPEAKGDTTALVVDIGRHSSRVAIVKANRPTGLLQVVSHDMTYECGGDLIDECMVNHLQSEIRQKHFKDENQFRESVSSSARVMSRLRQECERAKQALSQTASAYIELDSLFDGVDFSTQLTRARFDMLIAQPLQALMELVKKQMNQQQVDRVLVVGASARIPKVQELVKSLNVAETNCDSLVDEPIMSGAARQAYMLRTRIDHRKTEKTTGNVVDQEEEDRIRACEQLSVTPLSISVQTNGGLKSVVIPRNTILPATNTVRISNANNNASSLLLNIVQGERPFAADNESVSYQFAIVLPEASAERGTAQVDLTFSVDLTGKLSVSAKDASGNVLQIAKASKEENQKQSVLVEDVLASAVENAQADQERVVNVDSRLKLETYVYKMKAKHEGDAQVATMSDETLEWINQNSDKSHKDYLMKLRQYHSALPK